MMTNTPPTQDKMATMEVNISDAPLRLGYACINMTLRDVKPKKDSVCVNRSCIAKTFSTKGKDYAASLAKSNLEAVLRIMEWNYHHHIHLYRLSSDMFPHLTNPQFIPEGSTTAYDLGQFSEYFRRMGELSELYRQRLTFHPGPFNQIGTPKESVFAKTVIDLSAQADVLDRCGLDGNSVMVVHGGGVYEDKEATLERWISQFRTLPEAVRRRLVIENCERQYNYEDVLYLAQEVGRPVVFDTHHHNCYDAEVAPLEHPTYFLEEIVETWTSLGLRPKFHVSEQAPGKRLGAHSDYVEEIPDYLLELSKTQPLDIMIEAKAKELAVQHLYRKYPHFFSFEPRQ
jgi:UV DNA damage endonuclease